MKNRENQKYIIKVFEAQWDTSHEETVKPFFLSLKREMEEEGHDALYKYYVFQNSESLRDSLTHYQKDLGSEGRLKIAYFATHGLKDRLLAVKDISRIKLKNMLVDAHAFDGMIFGACDFANNKTAEFLLNNLPSLKWIAGYSLWTPWIEGTLCDIMFLKLLLGGKFVRKGTRAKWDSINRPEDAARELYKVFPMALDLKFSVYFRGQYGIISTYDENTDKLMVT